MSIIDEYHEVTHRACRNKLSGIFSENVNINAEKTMYHIETMNVHDL